MVVQVGRQVQEQTTEMDLAILRTACAQWHMRWGGGIPIRGMYEGQTITGTFWAGRGPAVPACRGQAAAGGRCMERGHQFSSRLMECSSYISCPSIPSLPAHPCSAHPSLCCLPVCSWVPLCLLKLLFACLQMI